MDGPGALSHFDLACKDCLGTAENTTSNVWFTVANGVLSDVYYPTNDNTNVETLQYVITNGSSFADIQTRDTAYTVQTLDNRALDCRVTATATSGKYRIVTDYLTDPAHNTVVMHTRFRPLVGALSSYKLYVIYNPSINGNGGGGSGNGSGDTGTVDTSTGHTIPVASDPVTATQAVNRTYAGLLQGFGQRYVDANDNTVDTVTIGANQISRYITFSMPKANLGGQPGPGWGFTVTLTGKDGFSPDQARSFASTPQPFQFGVCATTSTDPHCTVDPNTVPKVMDTITPPGVSQSDELDYTIHNPVILQDVVIP